MTCRAAQWADLGCSCTGGLVTLGKMASVPKAPGGLGRAGAIPALSLADACLACSPKPLSLQIPRQAIPVLSCARINSDARSLLQLHPIPFSWQRGAQRRFVPSFSQLFIQPFLLQTKQTPPAVSPRLFLALQPFFRLGSGCAQDWAGSSVSVPGSCFLGAHAVSWGISCSGMSSLLVLTAGPTPLLLKWASGGAPGLGVLWDFSC